MNFALRALRICEPEYLDSEINHISATFRSLRYPSHFIEKAISRARKVYYGLKDNIRNKPRRYLSLPFNPAIVSLCKEVNKNQNVTKIAFSYENTLRRSLIKNNNNNNKFITQGVYEIPCNDCSEKYYGESGRGLETRLAEHKRAYDQHATNSAIVSHAFNKDHRINWNHSNIIFRSNNVHIRRLIEGAAINLGDSFKGNKSFVNEDPFCNLYLVKNFLKNFHVKTSSVFSSPDAASASSLHVQVTAAQVDASYGTYPVPDEEIHSTLHHQPLRRSNRIAARNASREEIT